MTPGCLLPLHFALGFPWLAFRRGQLRKNKELERFVCDLSRLAPEISSVFQSGCARSREGLPTSPARGWLLPSFAPRTRYSATSLATLVDWTTSNRRHAMYIANKKPSKQVLMELPSWQMQRKLKPGQSELSPPPLVRCSNELHS